MGGLLFSLGNNFFLGELIISAEKVGLKKIEGPWLEVALKKLNFKGSKNDDSDW